MSHLVWFGLGVLAYLVYAHLVAPRLGTPA